MTETTTPRERIAALAGRSSAEIPAERTSIGPERTPLVALPHLGAMPVLRRT